MAVVRHKGALLSPRSFAASVDVLAHDDYTFAIGETAGEIAVPKESLRKEKRVARKGRKEDRPTLLKEYKVICRHRLEHLVKVDQPLALISQLPRSGGSLLMRLLDGHPQCHSMPIELSDLNWVDATESIEDVKSAWSTLHSNRREPYFYKGWRQTRSRKALVRAAIRSCFLRSSSVGCLKHPYETSSTSRRGPQWTAT